MGFMQQFQTPQAMMRDRINMLKSLVGGDTQGVMQQLSKSTNMCRLPDGQAVPVYQVIQQCQGKTPEEAYRQFGLDFSQVKPIM